MVSLESIMPVRFASLLSSNDECASDWRISQNLLFYFLKLLIEAVFIDNINKACEIRRAILLMNFKENGFQMLQHFCGDVTQLEMVRGY